VITNLAPHERIRRLLYIEKEGFSELIEGSGLLERFDMAMVSTKGMSVIAARQLIDHLVGANPDFEVYALVDFDITGADILRTLTLDTDRFKFRQRVNVRHLGVTWDQAQVLHERGLSEPVDLKGNGDDIQRRLSWASGLSAEATNFLAGTHPRRVELNAFTSQELLDIIESSVTGGKLIPADRLESTWAEMVVRAKVAAYEEEVRKQPPTTAVDGLMELVQALLLERPELSWDEAVAILAAEAA